MLIIFHSHPCSPSTRSNQCNSVYPSHGFLYADAKMSKYAYAYLAF